MKADDPEQRFKNALIYGTSHPEIYMTKADDLWEKYSTMHRGLQYMDEPQFLAALKEYGEHVKAEAVKVCNQTAKRSERDLYGSVRCAAAIEKMELP